MMDNNYDFELTYYSSNTFTRFINKIDNAEIKKAGVVQQFVHLGQSNNFINAILYLEDGCCKTPENLTIKNITSNIIYDINFDFEFNYNRYYENDNGEMIGQFSDFNFHIKHAFSIDSEGNKKMYDGNKKCEYDFDNEISFVKLSYFKPKTILSMLVSLYFENTM